MEAADLLSGLPSTNEDEQRSLLIRSRHWLEDAKDFISEYYGTAEARSFQRDLPSINANDNQYTRATGIQRTVRAGSIYLEVLRERPVRESVTVWSDDDPLPRLDEENPRTAKADLVNIDPRHCFVIMSFSGEIGLQDAYQLAVKPVVDELGFNCERVDEQHFNGNIMVQVQGNIRRSRFIIADLSEPRPNCYYELGIAHALDKQVILIAKHGSTIHFDVTGLNFIFYKGITDLKEKLKSRITGTILREPQ